MSETPAELMRRIAPSRVIFVLGWSSVAKDGILRKLNGPGGARDSATTFDTDSLTHRVYAPQNPDSSFVYVSLTSFAGMPLDDAGPAPLNPGVLDLPYLGSIAGIMLLCGPVITPQDRTLLRFVQAFFGPLSLSKVTVIFNLWNQCRDEAYTTLRAKLQGSATDPDIAAVRNPPSLFEGGKILTCAPRAAGDNRVTNLTPIVRKRYDALGGYYAKLQFVREIEEGREPARTEAARALEKGEDGGLRIVDGYVRIVSVSLRSMRGLSRSNTITSTTTTGSRRRSSIQRSITSPREDDHRTPRTPTKEDSESVRSSQLPEEFEPPASPMPVVAEPMSLFAAVESAMSGDGVIKEEPEVEGAVEAQGATDVEPQASLNAQTESSEERTENADAQSTQKRTEEGTTEGTTEGTQNVEAEGSEHTETDNQGAPPSQPTEDADTDADNASNATNTDKDAENKDDVSQPTLVGPTEETPLLSRPSTSSSALSSRSTSSTCLAQRQRNKISLRAVRKLLKRPLGAIIDALAFTKAKVVALLMRIRDALWLTFVFVPLMVARAAFWVAAVVVMRVLSPGGGAAEGVISSL